MKILIPVIALGMFSVLASFSYGRIAPLPKMVSIAPVKQPTNDKCNADWLCLVAWAEEQHPSKHKRRKS